MVSSRKLSSDEVDALIEGLQSDSDENSTSNTSDQDNVRPFKFGTDDLTLLGDYYALRMINERFARFARAVFLPMLRIQPRISSFPPEVKTFDEYTSGIESFMSLTASRIEELRGNMMLVMDPIWFGIFAVIVVEFGLISPPVGMNLFVIKGVMQRTPLQTIWFGTLPFLLTDMIRLALIIAFPAICLFLPSLMMS